MSRAPRAPDTVDFQYEFFLASGAYRAFTVSLEKDTLQIIPAPRRSYPEWVRLTYAQCPNCPLKPECRPHCPIATNLVDPIEAFDDFFSHEKVEVRVQSRARTYTARTTIQKALSSLLGITMPTSGCPIMDRLRPLVGTHLPFATFEETTYRIVSAYLLGQYFVQKRGGAPDWGLENLRRFMGEIETVNLSFSKRLRSIARKDAALNALTVLASSGSWISWNLEEQDFERWEKIFFVCHGPAGEGGA